MPATRKSISAALATLTAARLIQPELAATATTGPIWLTAINTIPDVTDADVTNAVTIAVTTWEKRFFQLPDFVTETARQTRIRKESTHWPQRPQGLTNDEWHHYRRAYMSTIKAQGGTPHAALDAAKNSVPRLTHTHNAIPRDVHKLIQAFHNKQKTHALPPGRENP